MIAQNREDGGRLVRDAWIAWAKHQANPKQAWLVGWELLPESDKEADRCIWDEIVGPYATALNRQVEDNRHNQEVIERMRERYDATIEQLRTDLALARHANALMAVQCHAGVERVQVLEEHMSGITALIDLGKQQMTALEEDNACLRDGIEAHRGFIGALLAHQMKLYALIADMQALYNQDVGDIVNEQGDRFSTVYDMCRVALNQRAQQIRSGDDETETPA